MAEFLDPANAGLSVYAYGELPPELARAISEAYAVLAAPDLPVAVRSSAIGVAP